MYAAYVFGRDGTAWTETAYLKAVNVGADDEFGGAVAVSDGRIAVGAMYEDSASSDPSDNSAAGAGAVYVSADTYLFLPLILRP